MFFESLDGLARIALAAVIAYAGLVVILRISGKRSLAKLNAFDFVVTVAFGSTLATVILSKDVPLLEGMLALAMLAAVQFMVSTLSVRLASVRDAVRSSATCLVRDGVILDDVIRSERVTRGEVESAIRKEGFGGIEDVAALVLETDGSFSVIGRSDAGSLSALRSVRGAPSARSSSREQERNVDAAQA